MLTARIVITMPGHVVCLRAYTPRLRRPVQMCPRADAARPGLRHLLLMNASLPLVIPGHLLRKQTRNAPSVAGPDRRGSVTAPAAAPGSSLIEAVLVAFQAHRVVAIGDAHAGQE